MRINKNIGPVKISQVFFRRAIRRRFMKTEKEFFYLELMNNYSNVYQHLSNIFFPLLNKF